MFPFCRHGRIIDHISTNDYEHFIIPGIVETNEISDYHPICLKSI